MIFLITFIINHFMAEPEIIFLNYCLSSKLLPTAFSWSLKPSELLLLGHLDTEINCKWDHFSKVLMLFCLSDFSLHVLVFCPKYTIDSVLL